MDVARKYSNEAGSPEERDFHDHSSRGLVALRRANEALDKNREDDLATTKVKRKQRSLLETAMRAVEQAQRLGFEGRAADERPVLNKYTLREAMKSMKTASEVTDHFGVERPVLSNMMRMFRIEPENPDQFWRGRQ